MLRTRRDAQAACVALVGANRERLAIPVNPRLHSRDQRQRPLILVAQLAHLEDVVRAGLDAVLFRLASRAIDHRREDACLLLALGFRWFSCHEKFLADSHQHAFDEARIDFPLATKIRELLL